jgi:hypothetical protein
MIYPSGPVIKALVKNSSFGPAVLDHTAGVNPLPSTIPDTDPRETRKSIFIREQLTSLFILDKNRVHIRLRDVFRFIVWPAGSEPGPPKKKYYD